MIEDDVREAIEARLKDELIVDQGILPDPIAAALARLAEAEKAAAARSTPSGLRSSLELPATLGL